MRLAGTVALLFALTTGACATSQFDRYLAEGRYVEAVRLFEADSSLWKEETPLFRVAVAHAMPGNPVYDPARARELLQLFLERFPSSSRAAEARRLDALLAELERAQRLAAERDEQIQSLTTRADSLAAEATVQRQLAQRLQSDLRRREMQIQTLEKELERLKAIDLRLSQPRKTGRPND